MLPAPIPVPAADVNNPSILAEYLVKLVQREAAIRRLLIEAGSELVRAQRTVTLRRAEESRISADLLAKRAILRHLNDKGASLKERVPVARAVEALAQSLQRLLPLLAAATIAVKKFTDRIQVFKVARDRALQDTIAARGRINALGNAAAVAVAEVVAVTPQEDPKKVAEEEALVVASVNAGAQAEAQIVAQTQEIVAVAQETAVAVQEAVATDPSLSAEVSETLAELSTVVETAVTSVTGAAASASEKSGLSPLAIAGIAVVALLLLRK